MYAVEKQLDPCSLTVTPLSISVILIKNMQPIYSLKLRIGKLNYL